MQTIAAPPAAEHETALAARPATVREWPALLDWLDDELRAKRRGRLRAELPHLLLPERAADHLLIEARGRPLAHAFVRCVPLRVRDVALSLGMIGLVVTDPAHRGAGLGSRVVEAAVHELAARGAHLVALWSDRPGFYSRLGFVSGGREWLWRLVAPQLAAARAHGDASGIETGPARAEELAALEALYAGKPVRVEREAGELARAIGACECEVQVARREGRAIAYAALGRGDDFPGVVHEWAGDVDGLVACLDALSRTRAALGLLSGAAEEPLALRLREAGAVPHPGPFAWLRWLRPLDVWGRVAGPSGELAGATLRRSGAAHVLASGDVALPLRDDELSALLAGPRLPARVLAKLPEPALGALRARLPLPLFVWGFDSI